LALEDDVIIGLSVALGAVATTQIISIVWERHKKNNEIEKIRKLLNSDFNRVYLRTKNSERNIEHDRIHQTEIEKILENFISKKMKPHEIVLRYSIVFPFAFWNAINSSGSLIKLEHNEIEAVDLVHNYIIEVERDVFRKIFDNFIVGLTTIDGLPISKQEKLKQLKKCLEKYQEALLEHYKTLVKSLEKLNKISWIKLVNHT